MSPKYSDMVLKRSSLQAIGCLPRLTCSFYHLALLRVLLLSSLSETPETPQQLFRFFFSLYVRTFVNFLHRLPVPLHCTCRRAVSQILTPRTGSARDIRWIFAGLYVDEIDVDPLRDKVSRVQQRLGPRNFDPLINFNKKTRVTVT